VSLPRAYDNPAAPGNTSDTKPTFVPVPTQLLELVKAGVLSRDAAWLYVVLLGHLNHDRVKTGDTKVWPARKTLAAAIGLRVARAVDRYLAELERAGMISIERRKTDKGDDDTNVYVLRRVHRGGSAPQNTTPQPAETGVTPARKVVPGGTPGVVPGGTPGVVLRGAHELEEVDPEEVQPSTPPRFAWSAELGASTDEERRIIAEVETRYGKAKISLPGQLNALHRDGKLAPILAALRAPERDRVADDWRRKLRQLPRCAHEVSGGTERHPTTGRMHCSDCNREQGKTPLGTVSYLEDRRTALAG
jgi:hypothetical protein